MFQNGQTHFKNLVSNHFGTLCIKGLKYGNVWKKYHGNTLNFGIGGDQDKDVFWRAINFPSFRTCYQLMWRKQYQ